MGGSTESDDKDEQTRWASWPGAQWMRTAQATKTWDGGGNKRPGPPWGLLVKNCWTCRQCPIGDSVQLLHELLHE